MAQPGEQIKVDAFGVIIKNKPEALKCDEHILKQYDLKLNKDTGVFETIVSGEVDLTELIQSNKDNCGLNLAFLQLSRGVDPSAFADDGTHGGDFSASTNINEAYQRVLATKQVASEVAKELGLDDYQNIDNLEQVITVAIKKKIADIQPGVNGGSTDEQ